MYDDLVRTTLDIDDDVLVVARQMAARQKVSLGRALSELARRGTMPEEQVRIRNGIRLLRPSGTGTVVTMELVNQLLNDE